MTQAAQPIPRTLKLLQVLEITSLSRTTLWRLVRDKKFPARVPLSANRVGWIESEVRAWQEERMASRSQTPPPGGENTQTV